MAKNLNHAQELMKNFDVLYSESKNPDIILVVEDHEFKVHRIVLATHSVFFQKLFFDNQFNEAGAKRIPIQAPLEAFQAILKYLYSGIIEIQESDLDDILQILELSERFCLDALKGGLIDIILPLVTVDNLHLIIKTAEIFESKKLKDKWCEVLSQNHVKFFESVKFLELTEKEMMQLFTCKNLQLTTIQKFQGLSKWIAVHPDCNKQEVLESVIDISKLSYAQIVNIVAPTNLYKPKKLLELAVRQKDVPEEVQKPKAKTKKPFEISLGIIQHNLSSSEIFPACSIKKEIVLDFRSTKLNCFRFYLDQRTDYKVYISQCDIDVNFAWEICCVNNHCLKSQTIYLTTRQSANLKLIKIQGAQKIRDIACSYDVDLPGFINNIRSPSNNIFTPENAYVVNGNSDNMLTWDFVERGIETPFTQSADNSKQITVCLYQPCYLSKFKVRVWNFDGIGHNLNLEVWNGDNRILSFSPSKISSGWYELEFPQSICTSFRFFQSSGQGTKITHFEASN